MTQLTTDPTPDWWPQWSPDGEQIVFFAYRSGNRDIWVMPAAGGPARQLTTHPAMDFVPSWSPDGREIAFSSTRSENRGLWVIPSAGGDPPVSTYDSDGFFEDIQRKAVSGRRAHPEVLSGLPNYTDIWVFVADSETVAGTISGTMGRKQESAAPHDRRK